MRVYSVELLPSAQEDIIEASQYFKTKSMDAALAFLDDIDSALDQLSLFPESAQLSRDEALAAKGYRVILIKYGYLVFYRFIGNKVIIYGVINGRQNYKVFIDQ